MEMLRRFYEEEDGMGTVEIVMIIAALVAVAVLFRKTIVEFVESLLKKVFQADKIADPY